MANNVTREEHLQSLATAAQQFALSTQNDTLNLVIEALQAAGSSSAASTPSLTTPTLSLGSWSKADTTYTASLSYSGDGNLSTNIGSISGTTLTVTDEDGIFSGVVTATAGTSYAATTLNFSYNTEAGGSSGSDEPTGLARNLTYTWIDALQEWQFSFDGQSEPIGYLLVTENGDVEHLTLTLTYNPQTQKNDYSLSKSSITSSGIVYVTVPAYGEYRAETLSLEVEV